MCAILKIRYSLSKKVKFTGNDYFMDGFLEFGACNDDELFTSDSNSF